MRDLFQPTVFGVGFFGEGKYKSKVNGKPTKVYNTWKGILERCYDSKYQEKHPSYMGCSMIKYWHNFQIFAEWFTENYNPESMIGWQLDKDILIKGNKVYSPNTCCFVPKEINVLFTKNNANRGELPIGVHKDGDRFRVILSQHNKLISFGTFSTIENAFKVYKYEKEYLIKRVAEDWKDDLPENTYNALINYIVEKTD